MTFRVFFVGGPYDGADFTFAERLPDRIEFGVKCLNADVNDPDVQEAIRENLSPPERDALVVTRNAQSIVETYQLDEDREGTVLPLDGFERARRRSFLRSRDNGRI